MAPNTRFIDVKLPYPVRFHLSVAGLVWDIKYQAKEEIAKELRIDPDGTLMVTIRSFRAVFENAWEVEGRFLNASKRWCDCKLSGIFDSPFTFLMEVFVPDVVKRRSRSA